MRVSSSRRSCGLSAILKMEAIFTSLGLSPTAENAANFDGTAFFASGSPLTTLNPATGQPLGTVTQGTDADYERCMTAALGARRAWAETPAPVRGEVVRKIGDELRKHKAALGALVSLEMGKILSEGLGEVQEFIDICDYAAGLSRMMGGQVLPSERAGHTLLECWSPIGVVAVISA